MNQGMLKTVAQIQSVDQSPQEGDFIWLVVEPNSAYSHAVKCLIIRATLDQGIIQLSLCRQDNGNILPLSFPHKIFSEKLEGTAPGLWRLEVNGGFDPYVIRNRVYSK